MTVLDVALANEDLHECSIYRFVTQIDSFDNPNHHIDLGSANPFRLLSDPIGFFRSIADEQGGIARISAGGREFVLINDPKVIEEVLIRRAGELEKFPRIDRTRGLFGEGLLTSEEPLHLAQRRLAQPAFHRDKLNQYAREMVSATRRQCDGWRDGETRDLAHEMGTLALDIVATTLFSQQSGPDEKRISTSLDEVVRTLNHLVTPWGNLLLTLPTPLRRRYRNALQTLDSIIYRYIAERRALGMPREDLMGLLMEAKDENGEGMPDIQLRDELMTMFVAGHDTTANALAWTLYLLSRNPEHRSRMEAEVDEVLQGREATAEDVQKLPVVASIFRESLRMYPPVWILGRRVLKSIDTPLIQLRKGAIVLVSMAVLHRRPELYSEPDRFDPGRGEASHKFAFLPFGAGSRLCIGERFAWLEGVLCLSTVAQKWRLELAEGAEIVPQPLLTLRPRNGLPMVVHKRSA